MDAEEEAEDEEGAYLKKRTFFSFFHFIKLYIYYVQKYKNI